MGSSHIVEYYLVIKKKWSTNIYHNMDEPLKYCHMKETCHKW